MENKREVPCKRDCMYFDYKGDDEICRLKCLQTWHCARDYIENEVCICEDYRK